MLPRRRAPISPRECLRSCGKVNSPAKNSRTSSDLSFNLPCWQKTKSLQPFPMPKILLVEDNEMNRDMLSRRLEKRGYTLAIAADGGVGVELAKSGAPDLILM